MQAFYLVHNGFMPGPLVQRYTAINPTHIQQEANYANIQQVNGAFNKTQNASERQIPHSIDHERD